LAITRSEFDQKLAEVPADYKAFVESPDGRRQFIDILIREKLVLAAAEKAGVTQDPGFKKEIRRLKKEEDRRLKEGRDYLLKRFWIDTLRKNGTIAVSDGEIRRYWEKHPDEVVIRQILAATPQQAEALLRKAKAGVSVAKLARAASLDADSAAHGGLMPGAIYGEAIPEFNDLIFRMKLHEISGPIKTEFGYHVVRKESEKKLSYNEARERIARLLEKEKLDRYLQSIKAQFPVEVYHAETTP
jgi:parvulin-like peptidyl-prolyl isomerase